MNSLHDNFDKENDINILNQNEAKINNLRMQIKQVELELNEFNLVLDLSKTLEPSRPCSRLLENVFIPHTSSGVAYGLELQKQKVQNVLKELTEKLYQCEKLQNSLLRV